MKEGNSISVFLLIVLISRFEVYRCLSLLRDRGCLESSAGDPGSDQEHPAALMCF